tara:strand:- start:24073 stop:26046 length:1974 start_codon:yes stop_codon:yes gene_type:complete
MDFFAQQDVARRNTRVLVLLFIFAVFLLILLTNALFAAFLYINQDYSVYGGLREGSAGFLSFFTWERFGGTGLAITATVGLVVLLKWIQLSTGGKAVAEGMGGSRILPQTRDHAERRCLNIVQELSLAANMPVPPVYVLNEERGINAFAAGITPADAVVGVTRGAIEQLKRHELQGVIAHEFSHILGGDMRLNIRLVAVLKGITFVGDVGYVLLRSSNRVRTGRSARNNQGAAAVPLLGLTLWLLGWIGGLVAGFIKSAISRQAEYLADASAVQYTRSTEGIGDALKVIGGYIPGTLIHAARATEMSHIFFGQIEHPLWHLFPTHPPLKSRIRRIDPNWNGEYIARKPNVYAAEPSRPGDAAVGVGRAALVAAAAASALAAREGAAKGPVEPEFAPDADFVAAPEAREQAEAVPEIPAGLVRHSREPLGAQAIVLALMLAENRSVAQQQLKLTAEAGVQGLEALLNTVYPGVHALGPPRRLPLLEICLPALKAMSLPQYRRFKTTLLAVIQADQNIALHEWCLFQLLRHYLDPEFVQVRPSSARHRTLGKVSAQVRVVLSVLAHAGDGDADQQFRRGADVLGFTDMGLMDLHAAGVAAFGKAVHELADCYPLLKPRLLKAMAQTAAFDGTLNHTEREIIASVAAVMDCPGPDLESLR